MATAPARDEAGWMVALRTMKTELRGSGGRDAGAAPFRVSGPSCTFQFAACPANIGIAGDGRDRPDRPTTRTGFRTSPRRSLGQSRCVAPHPWRDRFAGLRRAQHGPPMARGGRLAQKFVLAAPAGLPRRRLRLPALRQEPYGVFRNALRHVCKFMITIDFN